MNIRVGRWVLVVTLGLVATVGSMAVMARQQAAGSVLPGKFYIINKLPSEAVPVTVLEIGSEPMQALSQTLSQAVQQALLRPQPVKASQQVWEYRQLVIGANEDRAAALSGPGLQGWETTSIMSTDAKGALTIVLKRPR